MARVQPAKIGVESVHLAANSNQALGIAQFAIDFLGGKFSGPDQSVLKRTELFHTDSVVCGLSALALKTNAPTILRAEALEWEHKQGARVFGSSTKVAVSKAIVANSSAVREWDSNGTNFGYNEALNHKAGEFGHNDFYPVCVAAAQEKGLDGATTLRAMVCLDEIRGRLAEVFALKNYKIDHVVHGGIGSAAVYGALMGATAEQIEMAIGMLVAHYIPFRAIRAGHQLSDSKGASAAITSEVAIMCMKRTMKGFMGPRDIFRNPQAIFRLFEPTKGDSPFELMLTHTGTDFAIMGMHFKLGLYEHQSAGALQGLIDLLRKHPDLASNAGSIASIKILCYEPAFGIIGDPAKRSPTTRQSADHSMVFIVSRKLKKALDLVAAGTALPSDNNKLWQQLMLLPSDYSLEAVHDKATRFLMEKIEFEHGGKEYDDRYPNGIPTSVVITDTSGKQYDSGLVMYPSGHARNTTCDLSAILAHKFAQLGGIAVKDVNALLMNLGDLESKSPAEMGALYDCDINFSQAPLDAPAGPRARL
mmetsp:Transcript_18109/g.20275  ORF Transcript_18109/g.20275 Transcript_18109/m.20275 type:complete len:533 (+) Transcript_18109:2-1600(+)